MNQTQVIKLDPGAMATMLRQRAQLASIAEAATDARVRAVLDDGLLDMDVTIQAAAKSEDLVMEVVVCACGVTEAVADVVLDRRGIRDLCTKCFLARRHFTDAMLSVLADLVAGANRKESQP